MSKMTAEQHIGEILLMWATMSQAKYMDGREEHKSNLWELDDDTLIDNAIEEVIDLMNYLMTIKLRRK